MINIEPDDHIKAYMKVRTLDDVEYLKSRFIMFVTKHGVVKKTSLEAYSRPRATGIVAITINEGDSLISAALTNGTREVMMAARKGKAVRFHERHIRPMGRGAAGVRGITLEEGDEVVGSIIISDSQEQTVLVVSENGYGKRSLVDDYRVTNRGAKGVKTINITEKTGELIALKAVRSNDDLMIINRSGFTIRMGVEDIRVAGRATQGVRLINITEGDRIASVARVDNDEKPEVVVDEDIIVGNSTLTDTYATDTDDAIMDDEDIITDEDSTDDEQ